MKREYRSPLPVLDRQTRRGDIRPISEKACSLRKRVHGTHAPAENTRRIPSFRDRIQQKHQKQGYEKEYTRGTSRILTGRTQKYTETCRKYRESAGSSTGRYRKDSDQKTDGSIGRAWIDLKNLRSIEWRFFYRDYSSSSVFMERMATSVNGLSFRSVFTFAMASTMSSPSYTCPNTEWCRSRYFVSLA